MRGSGVCVGRLLLSQTWFLKHAAYEWDRSNSSFARGGAPSTSLSYSKTMNDIILKE